MFQEDLEARIDYHRKENQISYAEAIGVLCVLSHDLKMELWEEEREKE